MRDNVIEARSAGNAEIVLALAGESQQALPMLRLTDTYDSNWLFEFSGAELVRLFLQLENLLTADEADVHEWVDGRRAPQRPLRQCKTETEEDHAV